jgi:hypothetical protein
MHCKCRALDGIGQLHLCAAHYFEAQWQGTGWVHEYVFAPPRMWRFDYARPDAKVAVEIEGGTWVRGRHVTGAGYSRDAEKYNVAQLRGWIVIRLTSDMLRSDAARWCQSISDAIMVRR